MSDLEKLFEHAPEGADSLKHSVTNKGNVQWFKGTSVHMRDDEFAPTIDSHWKTIATRPQQTKTVVDAYAEFKGEWLGSIGGEYKFLNYCKNRGWFFSDTGTFAGLVCTQEEYYAYVNEKKKDTQDNFVEVDEQGNDWTHTYNDYGIRKDCIIIHDKPDDYGMILVMNRRGEYVLTDDFEEKIEEKTIKPKLTKSEYELLARMASFFYVRDSEFNDYISGFEII